MNYRNQFDPPSNPTQESAGAARPDGPGFADGDRSRGGSGALPNTGNVGGQGGGVPLDVWALVEVVLRRWRGVVLGAVALAVAGSAAGVALWHNEYTVLVQLIRYDSPNTQEVFPPRQTSPQTFAMVMKAPAVLQRVGAAVTPPIAPDELADSLKLIPERNSDLITISVTRRRRAGLVELANLYAQEAVRFTQDIQSQSAAEVNDFLKGQIAQLDAQIESLNERLSAGKWSEVGAPESPAGLPVSMEKLQERLATARDALADLLGKYTEAMPSVQEQRAKIAALEKQLAAIQTRQPTHSQSATGSGAPGETGESKRTRFADQADYEDLRTQLQSLENGRALLASRQRAAQLFVDKPPGYYKLFAPAKGKDVVVHARRFKVLFLAVFGGLVGALAVISGVLLVEVLDNRLKNAADVARVTHLPLVAALGDLDRMDAVARSRWAFCTWAALQHRLSPSPNHGLICGIISSRPGEGRSTWINLMAQAASQRGFRVLTIATRPSPPHAAVGGKLTGDAEWPEAGLSESGALTPNILASPAQVTQKLVGPDPQPHIHIPLPGWVWNLERRQQWQAALNHWRKINNIVILVELPPACVSESMLLAENLPNLLWLTDAGSSRAAETRWQLETLRFARCNLVGALLNHETGPALINRFPRWFSGPNGYPNSSLVL